jgi:ribonuclease Z
VSADGKTVMMNELLTYPTSDKIRYAFASDTVYDERVVKCVEGVNMLYHEATFLHEKLDRAIETMHSTAKQAAQVAKDAKVGKLLIGHYSSRYDDLSPLLNEAQSIFENTHLALEGHKHFLED